MTRYMETQNDNLKYDTNRQNNRADADDNSNNFNEYIRKKIERYRQNHQYHIKKFNVTCLAEKINKFDPNVSCEIVRKVVSQTKRTRKRDLIIAICICLEMSREEMDKALLLYELVPLREFDRRDKVFINAATDQKDLVGVNSELLQRHLPKLDLCDQNSGKKFVMEKMIDEKKYTVYEMEVRPFLMYYGDELSLKERYSPDNFYCAAHLKLMENATGKKILLEWGTVSDTVYDLKDDGRYVARDYDFVWSKEYKYEFSTYTDDLKYLVDRKMRVCIDQLNDTKNYGIRISAVFVEADLVVYGETFNYENPEYSEYYQIEIRPNQKIFAVSNQSIFMQRYLKKEKYEKLYGKIESVKRTIYHSDEEVLSDRANCIKEDGLQPLPRASEEQRLAHFQKLEAAVEDIRIKLANRELFVFNAREFIGIEELVKLFNVKEELDCRWDEKFPEHEFVPHKDSFIAPDGVETTWKDLYRALELGMGSVSDICNVRAKYGSIEGILNRRSL